LAILAIPRRPILVKTGINAELGVRGPIFPE
jgi:hypothetical protein